MNTETLVILSKSITCGCCGEITTVEGEYTCCTCGRMLCPACGKRWGWCKDHVPICIHPEGCLTTTEPVKMTGSCRHNMICLACGFGWSNIPDTCSGR